MMQSYLPFSRARASERRDSTFPGPSSPSTSDLRAFSGKASLTSKGYVMKERFVSFLFGLPSKISTYHIQRMKRTQNANQISVLVLGIVGNG